MPDTGVPPEITVVVSAYNSGPALQLCIASIAAQEFDGAREIIICDDGSTESELCAARCALARLELPALVIWQQDRGFRLSRSRNNAIRCARGRVLLFVDGDVVLSPRCLRTHWSAHSTPGVIGCGVRSFWFIDTETLRGAEGNYAPWRAAAEASTRPSVPFQRRRLAGPAPWQACVGCNFSVERKPEVYFDEAFEGWGQEDRELACRLSRGHSYSVRLLEDAAVVHVEDKSPDDAAWSVMRPSTPGEIAAYIRNTLTFMDKHPGIEDLVGTDLAHYRLSDSGVWERDPRPHSETGLSAKIRDARRWFGQS